MNPENLALSAHCAIRVMVQVWRGRVAVLVSASCLTAKQILVSTKKKVESYNEERQCDQMVLRCLETRDIILEIG